MLRWMAPFLSFTAEEAWQVFAPGRSASIFTETYSDTTGWADDALLTKWSRHPRDPRGRQQGDRGTARRRRGGLVAAGRRCSSPHRPTTTRCWRSLGEDLKFVTITSAVGLREGAALAIEARASAATKCERCWHWRDDVGADAAHPTICGRCVSNLHGAGEARRFA